MAGSSWSRRRRGGGGGEERGEPSGEGVVVDGPVDVDVEGLQPGGEARAEGLLEPEGRDLLGVGEDLRGCAGERDLALAQDDDAVGLEGLLHEVRDVHDRGAGRAQAAHDAHDGAASAHVEQGAGLVEDEQARLHGERAGDGDALLLAAGEACGVGLGEGAHGDAVELAADAALDLGGLDAEVLGAEGDVVLHDRGDDLVVGVLEHEAEALARAAVRGEVDVAAGEDLLAQERHVAGVRGEEPRQHEGERGLARAVGAQDADVLAGTDVERDVVEGERAALVAEGDVGERGHALLGSGRHGFVDQHAHRAVDADLKKVERQERGNDQVDDGLGRHAGVERRHDDVARDAGDEGADGAECEADDRAAHGGRAAVDERRGEHERDGGEHGHQHAVDARLRGEVYEVGDRGDDGPGRGAEGEAGHERDDARRVVLEPGHARQDGELDHERADGGNRAEQRRDRDPLCGPGALLAGGVVVVARHRALGTAVAVR